jgi:hypothetical protein
MSRPLADKTARRDRPKKGKSGSLCGIILLLAMIATCLPARAYSGLRLFSDPISLQADARSSAIITAQLQDDSGAPVKDGTVITFSTTLGAITSAAETRNGVARAALTSASATGTAIVSAMAGELRTDIEVEFLAGGGEVRPAASSLALEGKDLTYYPEARMVVANSGRCEYGGVVITAASLQCYVGEARIAAQGEVVISNGKDTLKGDALVFQGRRGKGQLLRYEDAKEAIFSFFAPALKETREAKGDPEEFQAALPSGERNLILAKKIYVRPDGKLLMRNATMQLDGVAIASLPQYVADLNGSGQSFTEQALSMNKAVGVMADFPYYYAATNSRIGCLRLTHNVSPEGAMQRRGWGANLEEQYLLGDDGQGTINLDDLAAANRGLRWSHTQRLSGSSQLLANLRYTQFDPASPRVLDLNTAISKSLPGIGLALALRASGYSGTKSYGADLSANTTPRRIGGSGFSFSTGARINYGLANATKTEYSDSDGGVTLVQSDSMTPSTLECLSLRLHCPEWKLSKQSYVSSGMTLSGNWMEEGSYQSLTANAGFNRRLPGGSGLHLSYCAQLTSDNGDYGNFAHRQTLNFNLNYRKPGKMEAGSYAFFDIESSRFTGNACLSYFPAFQRTEQGDPRWELSFAGMLNRWQGKSVSDLRLGLTRALGNWQVSLNYAPHGSEFDSGLMSGDSTLAGTSGYGFVQELGRTFWIEIAPCSF